MEGTDQHTRTGSRAHRPGRHAAAVSGALIAIGLLAAGCVSSSPTSNTSSPTVVAQALAFSNCMRAHGVSNFPDRGDKATGSYTSIAGIEIPSSIDMKAPVYRSANASCMGLLAAVFSPQGKPALTAGRKAALIAQAQCMREHGVPSYPDPTFPASGGISIQVGSGFSPQSPGFRQAGKACHTGTDR